MRYLVLSIHTLKSDKPPPDDRKWHKVTSPGLSHVRQLSGMKTVLCPEAVWKRRINLGLAGFSFDFGE